MPFAARVLAEVAAAAVTVHRTLGAGCARYIFTGLSTLPAEFAVPAELDSPETAEALEATYRVLAARRHAVATRPPHASARPSLRVVR
jgi:hypothetical protein